MTEPLLNNDWVKALSAYTKLYVGFSGGLDSSVLLHVLSTQPKLVNLLCAVHINHGLSPDASAWQSHCEQVCQDLKVSILVRSVQCTNQANVEENARLARYAVFKSLLGVNDACLFAHHADDQAETLLLNLLRGAGIDGLAAMPAIRSLQSGHLLRPLLQHSRQTLLEYAQLNNLVWVEDASNQDQRFSRNYLRQVIFPLLTKKWPGVVGNFLKTTQHCQQAMVNLTALAEQDCPQVSTDCKQLSLANLPLNDTAKMCNILREWFKKSALKCPSTVILNRIITEVILAGQDAIPSIELQNMVIRRYRDDLYLIAAESDNQIYSSVIDWDNFPETLEYYDLSIEAKVMPTGVCVPSYSHVQIKFRKGGESIVLNQQTKKLKTLWQMWRIPPWLRDKIPLLFIDGHCAMVIGYAISDLYATERCENLTDSYQITYKLTSGE